MAEQSVHLSGLIQARQFIDHNLAEQLSLLQIAEQASFSKYHFLRLFQSVYQETPHQYLTRRRIERARELLICTDLSVTEICFAVGFESLGSFSTLFQRHTGRSPLRYRSRVFASVHSAWQAAPAFVPVCFLMWFGVEPSTDGGEPAKLRKNREAHSHLP